MVRFQRFHCQDLGSVPGWGTEILQAAQHGQKEKRKKRMRAGTSTPHLVFFTITPACLGSVGGEIHNMKETADLRVILFSSSSSVFH